MSTGQKCEGKLEKQPTPDSHTIMRERDTCDIEPDTAESGAWAVGQLRVTQPRQTRTEGATQPPAPHLHRPALFNPDHCRKCRTSAATKRRTNRRRIREEDTEDLEPSVTTLRPRDVSDPPFPRRPSPQVDLGVTSCRAVILITPCAPF